MSAACQDTHMLLPIRIDVAVLLSRFLISAINDSPEGFSRNTWLVLAIRPEKLELSLHEPDNNRIKFLSRVVNVVYYGSTSQVFLEKPSGEPLMAEIRNRESDTATSILIGSKIWVSWQAADTLVLTE